MARPTAFLLWVVLSAHATTCSARLALRQAKLQSNQLPGANPPCADQLARASDQLQEKQLEVKDVEAQVRTRQILLRNLDTQTRAVKLDLLPMQKEMTSLSTNKLSLHKQVGETKGQAAGQKAHLQEVLTNFKESSVAKLNASAEEMRGTMNKVLKYFAGIQSTAKWQSAGPGTVCRKTMQDESEDANGATEVQYVGKDDCKRACRAAKLCYGVEVSYNRCEMWKEPIGTTASKQGFECIKLEKGTALMSFSDFDKDSEGGAAPAQPEESEKPEEPEEPATPDESATPSDDAAQEEPAAADEAPSSGDPFLHSDGALPDDSGPTDSDDVSDVNEAPDDPADTVLDMKKTSYESPMADDTPTLPTTPAASDIPAMGGASDVLATATTDGASALDDALALPAAPAMDDAAAEPSATAMDEIPPLDDTAATPSTPATDEIPPLDLTAAEPSTAATDEIPPLDDTAAEPSTPATDEIPPLDLTAAEPSTQATDEIPPLDDTKSATPAVDEIPPLDDTTAEESTPATDDATSLGDTLSEALADAKAAEATPAVEDAAGDIPDPEDVHRIAADVSASGAKSISDEEASKMADYVNGMMKSKSVPEPITEDELAMWEN